jgi:hypothetical protein
MKNNYKKLLFILPVTVIIGLTSCRKTIDTAHKNYIGSWSCISCVDDISIDISENGRGAYYKTTSNGVSTTVSGNVKFSGSNLKIGVKKFSIDKTPVQDTSSILSGYKMTLDGDDFFRTN